MKKSITSKILAFILIMSAISCSLFAVYLKFSDETQQLFVYEVGDQISFLRQPNNDTLKVEVVSREVHHKRGNAFLRVRDYYDHICEIVLSSDDLKINIIFIKENIEFVIANINIEKEGEFNSIFQGGTNIYEDSINTTVYYLMYTEAVIDTLVYTTENGIEKFNNSARNETYHLIK